MNSAFQISYLVLWTFVIILAIVMAACVHLLGVLFQRLPPRAARVGNAGPEIGTRITSLTAQKVDGTRVQIPSATGKTFLCVFVSPTCSTCKELAPIIRTVAENEPLLEVVVAAIHDDIDSLERFLALHELRKLGYIPSPEVARTLGVSTAPYALLFSPDGTVIAKGLINRREDLESILNTMTQPLVSAARNGQ